MRSDMTRRTIAALAALPLLALAAPAAAAPSDERPAAITPPTQLLGAPIASAGARLVLGGEDLTTGELSGRVNIVLATDPLGGAVWQADFTMASPVILDADADLGQARVATTGQAGPSPEGTLAVAFTIEAERLPGALNGTMILAPVTEGFPPVNQQYALQEPVTVYSGDEASGSLDSFAVIVNQSA